MGRRLTALTPLQEFLKLPEMKPSLEFIDGRIIQKMSPMLPHSVIQIELVNALNSFARPRKLGRAFHELSAVFGNSSQVPDVSFYVQDRLPTFIRGQEPESIKVPADLCAEILSTGQTAHELVRKIRISLEHGSELGWLIEPVKEQIRIIRPGTKAEILKAGAMLSGEPVIPGFTIPVAEIFDWLDLR